MANSLSFLLCNSILLLLCQVSTAKEDNPHGIGALNNLQFFQFDESASFRCETKASRCGFDYDDYNAGGVVKIGGAFNELEAGTVWTVESIQDELRATGCIDGDCVVYCFADCNCTELTTDNACNTTTPMPSPAPVVTPSPVPYVCPLQSGKSECASLMTNSLPTTDPGCDCYNFCDGQFLSCCNELSEKCGDTTCASGLSVMGCTKEDVKATTDEDKTPNGGNNPAGSPTSPSSFATVPSVRVGKLVAGLGAVVVVALGP